MDHHHLSVENEEYCWPDNAPGPSSEDENNNDHHVRINDVSRMSSYPTGTPISRIFFPRCENDVLCILQEAYNAKKCIGIRGTKHSMGGHSIASQMGWEIDTKFLRHITYDNRNTPDIVRCGPGCQWSDLIKVLNVYGKSPRTMQSYSNFSVGGTLAVNAHGITTDYCFSESVLEMRLARVSTQGKVTVVTCKPPDRKRTTGNRQKKKSWTEELFSLVLGGYGLFGVITEVVLKVETNVKLELDTMHLNMKCDANHRNSSEFLRIYDNCRSSHCKDNDKDKENGKDHDNDYDDGDNGNLTTSLGKVEIKLARLNTITLDKASLYVFRSTTSSHHSSPTVSDLPPSPRQLSPTSKLLYKWALPLLKDVRYAQEENSGTPLDWSQDETLNKNQLLFESAVPLSKLYEPLLKKDDTFILQEFFCPHSKMIEWINVVKPIYKDIEAQQHEHGQDLILLNTTIRFVERDDISFLRYSTVSEGMFAFVLYYRIKRDANVEQRLGDFHNRLAEATIGLGGTFYLPYRRCYSAELLKAAYPMIGDFARKKEEYDPDCLFSNLWFEQYVLPLCSEHYKIKWSRKHNEEVLDDDHPIVAGPETFTFRPVLQKVDEIQTKEEFWDWLPRKDHPYMIRRTNSYRNLIRSKELRDQFREQFLVQIFNLADPDEVMRVMTRAAWDPCNRDDFHIYEQIYQHFHGTSEKRGLDVLKLLSQYWRGIQQLREQKEELTRETFNIVMRLGKLGKLNGYVCLGDHGKTVKQFVHKIQISGKVWVVHNSDDVVDKTVSESDSTVTKFVSLETVLERGSLDSVADEEILFDYCSDLAHEKLDRIPTNSVDLVTMNQGLHHIPLENLYGFLVEVKRILRPDGIFITREHDLRLKFSGSGNSTTRCNGKVPYPMLDLAHSVFNAVTGVSVKEEMEEIRAFRPIIEWREILARVGFIDTMVSDVEDGDPTWDEMLAFYKPCTSEHQKSRHINGSSTPVPMSVAPTNKMEPPIFALLRTLLGQAPALTASAMEKLLQFVKQKSPEVCKSLRHIFITLIPNIVKELDMVDTGVGLITRQAAALFETKLVATSEQINRIVDGALSLLSQSEIQKLYNFKNLMHTPELFLLLPYLERKVNRDSNNCNEVEKMVVVFIKTYVPSLLFDDEKEDGDEDAPSSADSSTIRIDVDNVSGEVTEAETEQVFNSLFESIPGLLDPDILLVQSGFSLTQQTTLVAKFGGTDFSSFCRNFAGYLDRSTWTEMKAKLKMVENRKELPTKDRLLSSPEHPWHQVAKTFMKSPKVVLNAQAMFGLKMIGLGEIESLYKTAKQERIEGSVENPCFERDVVDYLLSLDDSLEKLGSEWMGDIVKREFTYDTSTEIELWDVAEVISAKFGYKSLTSRKVDVTKELQRLHAHIHAKLANPGYNFRIPDKVQLGWLPLHEEILVEMRNKGSVQKEVSDTIRKGLVNVATLGLAGNNQLKIKYRRAIGNKEKNQGDGDISVGCSSETQSVLHSGFIHNLVNISGSLSAFLESKDLVRSDLHPTDGHYTFYKLNEWMQVEILDELIKSLDHTPWYRFPFMQFISTYFDVLRQQCQIVQRKYGTLTAYGSKAFFVDLIPGIVMTFLFGQLQALATPLKMMTPPDGYAGLDQSRFLEEIVLRVQLPRCNNGDNDWNWFFKAEVDSRILNARVLPGGFVIIKTPPFKAMGEVLIRLATRFPAARVFQISNQQEVQVRVSRTLSSQEIDRADVQGNDHGLEKISSLPCVERLMQYHFPNTHGSGFPGTTEMNEGVTQMKEYYCFQVHCLSLLDVIRMCNLLPNHDVEQIYDFWN